DTFRGFGLFFSVDKPCTLWEFPVCTVSSKENGFEKTVQGLCYIPSWKIYLDPHEQFNCHMRITVNGETA
ncbi:MAG: DUF1926 domain-containing protein, partial [Elusimicrobia bacterium]|nr:DUF1926 domain-containing protein [Elusimicrobiota bacterium]MBD3411801.1 DUF1926 domain-containing protein [Elusimicrobiota bacterium]